MSPEKRTLAGWAHHLSAPDVQLSLSELMAVCLLHIRDNLIEAREAAQHTEGMVSSLDVLASTLAGLNGLPYDAARAMLPQKGGADGGFGELRAPR